MTRPNYTVSWILPIVRRAVKVRGDFEYATYIQQLWDELHRLQVVGVVKESPDLQQVLRRAYDWNQTPPDLYNAAIEAFFFLGRQGYIIPTSSNDHLHNLQLNRYRVTERGVEWFNGAEPIPEDIAGYMKVLRDLVPQINDVVEQYVTEALIAFERQAYFAAAVMLGAASEKSLYLLAESMVGALKQPAHQQKLQKLLDGRSLNRLFICIRENLERNRNTPNVPFDGSINHLISLFEAVRTQRNDAVHPATGQVSCDSVRLLTASFPLALSKSVQLRDWLSANPLSLD